MKKVNKARQFPIKRQNEAGEDVISLTHNLDWRESFKQNTMKTSFLLQLSQPMIELLSAIADDCTWDRGKYPNLYCPDNIIATETALEKRGLVVRKPLKDRPMLDSREGEITAYCVLTPAGKALIELFKVTGLFIEAEAALNRKKRKA